MQPREVVNKVVLEEQSDRYYKSFSTWDELVSLLFGVFIRCDSAREVCDGMAALGGKLNYLGMDRSPAKSTFNDGLSKRSEDVFEKFYVFDSTTISLFSDILKGVGRNRKDDGRKKGGLKVHLLTDVHADSAKFVKMSEAKPHDKNFLTHLTLPPGSMAT